MNLTDEQLARFEAAAEGALSTDERQLFETELTTDGHLRAEWVAYCQLRHALESIPMKQQLMAMHTRLAAEGHFDNDEADAEPTIRPLPASRRFGWWWGVAAGVALAIGIFWWTSPGYVPNTQPLFAENYRPERAIRGTNDCGPSASTYIADYRKGQYQTALEQLTNVPTADACTYYYRGLCQLALQHPEAAIPDLQQAQKQSGGLLQQRADWYLAIAYLAINDADEAERVLTRIAKHPDHPFAPRAQEVLAQLVP